MDICICTSIQAHKDTEAILINARKKAEDTDSVVIFVQDTGEGMKREDVEHIFERFYKVDSFKPGTGLGLPICETIINRFMGHIDVISEVGKGSCFEITLPLNACKILD